MGVILPTKTLVIEDEQGNVVSTQDISNLHSGEHKLIFNFDASLWQGKMRVYTTGMYPGSVKITNVSCAAPIICNQNWDKIVLALKFDEGFNDLTGKISTIYGAPTISTANFKFGIASAYFPGGAFNDVTFPSSSDFTLMDFSIGMHIYIDPEVVSRTCALVSFHSPYASASISNIRVSIGSTPGTGVFYIGDAGSDPVSVSGWRRILATRTGNELKLFVDNQLIVSFTDVSNNYFQEIAPMVSIGSFRSIGYGSFYMKGYIDDLEIYNGVAITETELPITSFSTIQCTSIIPQQSIVSKSVELFWDVATEPIKFTVQDIRWVIGPYNHTIVQDVYFSVIPLITKENELNWSTYPMIEKDVELSWVNKPTIEQSISYTIAPIVYQVVLWSNHRTISAELGWEIGHYKDQELSYTISPSVTYELVYTIGNTISTELNWTIANYSTKDLLWSIEG